MKRRFICSTFFLMALGASTSAWAMSLAYSIQESTQSLVSINLATGAVTVIGATGGQDIDGLALDSNGVLYGSDNDTNELVILDRNTGAITTSFSLSADVSDTGIAFNSADVLFLADDAGSKLFTVNTANGVLTLAGTNAGDISAIAFDSADNLHAVDPITDALVTLNVSTGAFLSVIGGLGFDASDEQGLTYDFVANIFYMVDDGNNSLYSVDAANGSATFIADLGTTYENLAFYVAPIPIPAALWLFGSALALMGFTRFTPSRP